MVFAHINHWGMGKNWPDFGDLDLIFNVRGGQSMLKMHSAYFLKGLIGYGMCSIWR